MLKSVDSRCDRAVEHARDRPDYPYIFRLGRTCRIGLAVILVIVALAVAIFIICGSRSKEYEFLDKEPFETEYGVTGMVNERKKEFKDTYLLFFAKRNDLVCEYHNFPSFCAFVPHIMRKFYIFARLHSRKSGRISVNRRLQPHKSGQFL